MSPRPRLLLMRGLPSCGKSTRARELAGDAGVVFEFDSYFVGSDGVFRWRPHLRPKVRRALLAEMRKAADARTPVIVMDDDNGTGTTTRAAVLYCLSRGYTVKFEEPQTPWWREIRKLLVHRRRNSRALLRWAQKLSLLNRGTHGVSAREIARRMGKWPLDLTVKDICLGRIQQRDRTAA